VQRCFSDGDALPDGRVVFSASAEAEADDAHEGPTAGTTIGIIEADGTLGFSDFVDNDRVKIEGVDAVLKDGKIELLLTADEISATITETVAKALQNAEDLPEEVSSVAPRDIAGAGFEPATFGL